MKNVTTGNLIRCGSICTHAWQCPNAILVSDMVVYVINKNILTCELHKKFSMESVENRIYKFTVEIPNYYWTYTGSGWSTNDR